MEEVEAICDELAIIDRGRVIVQDRMERLLHRGTKKLLSVVLAQPLPAAAQAALATWQPVTADGLRWTLSLPGGASQIGDVLSLLAGAGVTIEQLQFGVTRLEQIYLGLLEERGSS